MAPPDPSPVPRRPPLGRRVRAQVMRRLARLDPRHVARATSVRMGALAILVGLLTGGGIILFREGIALVQALSFGAEDHTQLATVAAGLPWWAVILPLVVGGLAVGLLHRALMPDGRPETVSHVLEAAMLRGGRMPLGRGLVAALGSLVSLGVGASVGREGPAVHLGATLGAAIARLTRLGHTGSRTLLGCGAGAAVAASFNAPIAGALFAHEVVVGHYAASAFAPVVISSVTATVISRLWFGDAPAFILPDDLILTSFLEFPAFAVLGLISGVLAALFMGGMMAVGYAAPRLPGPSWARPALAGLLVGGLALHWPEILGVGYEVTDQALNGDLLLDAAVAITLVKLLATALCLGLGFGGGVFSPSLTLGAVAGCAFGLVASGVFPDLSSGAGAYAIAGMGAAAAAVLGAPISTSLIIFELTANYALTIAVMIAVVMATTMAQALTGHRSVFHWQLARRGLDVDTDRQRLVLRDVRVRDLIDRHPPTVLAGASLADVAQAFRASDGRPLCVVDPAGRLLGSIVLTDVAEALFNREEHAERTALDLAMTDPPVLELSETLDDALGRLEDLRDPHMSVVRDRDSMMLAGVVSDRALMQAHARALTQLRAEDRGDPSR
ncbi:chloride channel protein [Roseospira visakhapatnamensis]|uniref:CIC family chloride channel protein n=1 Tax=Roseospira visakhapatnamensis TaxID=390880 RepID=A0A7W6WAM4_9PROT|nr:chloride channel protein [Roseospira visakhapatnamensis]MBB4266657.1 CIC family chloride channel protein [Roseospira visakhapatnamensis]